MNIEEPYCAVCRRQIAQPSRHVQVEATTKGEDKPEIVVPSPPQPEHESYRFHLSCWDSVASGWGRPG